MSKLVRIKPYSPKKGYVLRSYTYQGNRYQEGRGWYEVDESTAAYLEGIKQRDEDPESHDAFDVCTEAEARLIDEKEAKKSSVASAAEPTPTTVTPRRVHAPAKKPAPPQGVLTTADLAEAPKANKSTSFDHDEDAGEDHFDDGPVEPEEEPVDEDADDGEPEPPVPAPAKPAKGSKRK